MIYLDWSTSHSKVYCIRIVVSFIYESWWCDWFSNHSFLVAILYIVFTTCNSIPFNN